MSKTKASVTNKINKKKSPTAGQSVVTTVPDKEETRTRLIKKLSGRVKDGGNSIVDDFMKVADRVMALYPSFSFQEFLSVGKGLDFQDFKELRRLYDAFTSELTFQGVLTQEVSIYDDGFIFLQVRA